MQLYLNLSILGTKRWVDESRLDYKKSLSESASVKKMATLARLENKNRRSQLQRFHSPPAPKTSNRKKL
jgi:hypothetical protein